MNIAHDSQHKRINKSVRRWDAYPDRSWLHRKAKREMYEQATSTLSVHLRQFHGWRPQAGDLLPSLLDLHALHARNHAEQSSS